MSDQPQLMIIRGIPASGKSTFARKWVAEREDRFRVSRDDLRAMTRGQYVLPPALENTITKVEHAMVEAILQSGNSALIDAQNLRAANVRQLLKIAQKHNAVVLHKDFYIDIDVALERNRNRDRRVPEDVIIRNHKKFAQNGKLVPFPALLEQDMVEGQEYTPLDNTPPAVILDVDGTAMNMSPYRSPYDYDKVSLDTPNVPVIETVKALQEQGYLIIVMSGREDSCYDDTLDQLMQAGIDVHELHMRATGDQRKDSIIKLELFNAHIRNQYDVLVAIDDRDQVVDMYRKQIGIPVFQVNYGNF